MSSLQARVQVLFEDSAADLARKISQLNKSTCRTCPDNRFITFFMTIADPSSGQLTYVNAGHNPPLLIRTSGQFEDLAEGGIILGITPMAAYQESQASLDPGRPLLLCFR